jgi:hypothetical protein
VLDVVMLALGLRFFLVAVTYAHPPLRRTKIAPAPERNIAASGSHLSGIFPKVFLSRNRPAAVPLSWATQRLACNACERQVGAASDLFRRIDRFGRAIDRSGPPPANSVAVSMGRLSKPTGHGGANAGSYENTIET